MKAKLMIAAAAVAAVLSAGAWAQMGPGMGGYGPGGYGPGMMWGSGPGEGYGPGYGRGPGMMGGVGPRGGRGPWMSGAVGPGGTAGLALAEEQRAKVDAIQAEFSRQRWDLMGKMREQRSALFGTDPSGKTDDSAARKAYEAMSEMRKAMFENGLEMRKRIDAVLTNEQREQLRRGGCRFG